jgi:hypothetical protein
MKACFMGSLYIDFLNQLTSPTPEENDETLQLICECSRGELKFDSLESQNFKSIDNCNIRGICAYVAKNKHLAKISSKHIEIAKKFEERVKIRKQNKKAKNSGGNEDDGSENKTKTKSLLKYI